MTLQKKFYSGTSGLALPVSNKSGYPPEFQNGSRLGYYAHLFNSIEINSSFYKVPMARTVAKWTAEVPDGFRFTYKLWRDITHVKDNIVLHDKAGSQMDFIEQDGPDVYLRFHGPGGNYRGSYSEDFLYEYSEYIKSWIEEGKTVYTYFNNTMGDAVKNLMTLNEFVLSDN